MPAIPDPKNEIQRRFNELFDRANRPPKDDVLRLLRDGGQRLNQNGYRESAEHLAAFPDASPWHVCFAVGLAWGHLAKLDLALTRAAINLMKTWNSDDVAVARRFAMERGPDPIEQSLMGAHALFNKVVLPSSLPGTLDQLTAAQNRWLSPVLSKDRPRYIGSWNATAMFMIALFAQPALAATMRRPGPMLPPGGPIHAGLAILHRHRVLSKAPAGSDLDDQAFEPGAIYENNALFEELCRGLPDWSLIDVHSGVYMLGTRSPLSDQWI